MTELTITAAVLAALGFGGCAWTLVGALDPVRRRVRANLARGMRSAAPDHEPLTAAGRRSALESLALRLTPKGLTALLDRQHVLAGRPPAWPLERLLLLKLVWLPTAAFLCLLVLGSSPPPLIALMSVLVAVVVYFLPELLLNSTGQKRNQAIELELADTLDQMMISVEAGLGFDAAMAQASRKGKGPLAEELRRTFQDIQIGRSRRQAFEGLTVRTTVPDLRRFVRAIIQADLYGISIGDVLRTQANEMRLKRRQRAEEKAQKIPVKVLLPLMLFILPVLFIVVLGPAVINMVAAFGNM